MCGLCAADHFGAAAARSRRRHGESRRPLGRSATGGTVSPTDKDKKPPAKDKSAAPSANPGPAGDPPPPDAPGPDAAAIDREIKALQGTWVYTKFITGGKEHPVTKDYYCTLTFKDQTVTSKAVTKPDKNDMDSDGKDKVEILESDFALDLSKKPKQISYALNGFKAPSQNLYEIKGNTLKIIGISGVEKPPSDFSGKDEVTNVEVYMKKVKLLCAAAPAKTLPLTVVAIESGPVACSLCVILA